MSVKGGNTTQSASGVIRGQVEARIQTLLAKDYASGTLQTSRGGKISRKHYAEIIGCSHSALTRYHDLFSHYERLANIQTGPMRHVDEMRDWLEREYQAGRLRARSGKVDRSAFQEYFGLKCGSWITKYPEIRTLFEAWDARVQAEGYLPKQVQQELERLKTALAGEPGLNTNRLSVNRVALSETVGISKNKLKVEPFATLILEHETVLLARASESQIDPLVHGRVFPFSDLDNYWSSRFLKRVGSRFKLFAPSLSRQSVKRPYLELVNLLAWLGANSNPSCRAVVQNANADGRINSVDHWEDALMAYRDELLAKIARGTAAEGTIDSNLKSLRIVLSSLASGGVVPEATPILIGVKHLRQKSARLKSVAEADASSTKRSPSDYVEFTQERLREIATTNDLDLATIEATAFFESLDAEFRDTSGHPASLPEAVRRVLEKRLDALRAAAEALVSDAITTFEQGRSLLKEADLNCLEFDTAYFDPLISNYKRTELVRQFIPNPKVASESQVQRGIANLLKLIEENYDGHLPAISATTSDRYGAFFAKRLLEYGGLQRIAPLTGPTHDAVAAVLTLYLLESGSNVSVGRTLERDCLSASGQDGYVRIDGSKSRARGKPIIVDVPESSFTVNAIRWLSEVNERWSEKAGSNAQKLFLGWFGSRFQLAADHWYTAWFKRFASGIVGLEDFNLVPSMIRPSVLLHAALSNDGRLTVGLAQGQHSLSVSQGYQQKWPTRLLYDQNIRRFQTAFETLVLSNVEDAASKLGISEEEFENRLKELRPTGLGTFCKNEHGRSSNRSGTCTTLDCWNDCPQLVIVAEVEAIAALQLWQSSLRAAQGDWERDRPERWDEVWLPWLCLTDVVEEKMARGPMIKIWKTAQAKALEISAQPGYVPPRPW
ncbi:hypothetical protein FIU86_06665 [Roseovarius sp. THAF9]|uniref:hypothetical protein n=1 Tax=Roseovarius sp. THAF9 TaxID=2587847 RepID=UPI001267C2DB|nr:hypothetical protein [Roseovarius sp. THAF9]QFT92516.1 hypothetical protein FIU86_06665 [Roseovarius sp. THAF9]